MQPGTIPLQRAQELSELLAKTPYRPIECLGRGGMGEVFVVEHEYLGKRFALKVVHPHKVATPGLAERLLLEAHALARLHDPHVVEITDLWISDGGAPCLVLELLQGSTLAQKLADDGPLSPPLAMAIAHQTLRGLGAAHGIGIVHRDVKPQNVFLHQPPGFDSVVKILDFGLARLLADAPRAPAPLGRVRTVTGALVGTPRYMSPEALRGEKLDERTDLFCVGLLLYEMLTEKGPYDYDTGPPKPPSAHASQISPQLDALVLRAIHEQRELRFQSAQEFLGALEALAPSLPNSRLPWERNR